MPVIGRTPNFNLALPYGNRQNWTDLVNGNTRTLDAVLATFVSVNNLQGVWTNNTEYVIGDNVVDETAGVVYTAQVDHTSASAPTTFLEERTDNPTYWLTFSVAARQRGAWQTATAYALNDFVLADGTKYAMCISAHTSGASFTTDLAAGKWTVMIDLSAAGSLVLPVLSGGADANKVVMADGGGNSYVINAISTLLGLLTAAQGTTGSGSFVLDASPALTGNPTAPTPAIEDNDTSIATTAALMAAVRALTIRVQTFSGSGTYTPHAKLIFAIMFAIGGGGGGGGAVAAASGGQAALGGSGGAGSLSIKVASISAIGASQTVTIGAAGTAGSAGNNNGGSGGDTSIGTLCVGKGGAGGAGNAGASLNSAPGGVGGIAGTGDVTMVGENGSSGVAFTQTGTSNRGGNSWFGSGGYIANPDASSRTGGAGTGFGTGGSGGQAPNGAANAAGGAGTAGYAFAIELCYG